MLNVNKTLLNGLPEEFGTKVLAKKKIRKDPEKNCEELQASAEL